MKEGREFNRGGVQTPGGVKTNRGGVKIGAGSKTDGGGVHGERKNSPNSC